MARGKKRRSLKYSKTRPSYRNLIQESKWFHIPLNFFLRRKIQTYIGSVESSCKGFDLEKVKGFDVGETRFIDRRPSVFDSKKCSLRINGEEIPFVSGSVEINFGAHRNG